MECDLPRVTGLYQWSDTPVQCLPHWLSVELGSMCQDKSLPVVPGSFTDSSL